MSDSLSAFKMVQDAIFLHQRQMRETADYNETTKIGFVPATRVVLSKELKDAFVKELKDKYAIKIEAKKTSHSDHIFGCRLTVNPHFKGWKIACVPERIQDQKK